MSCGRAVVASQPPTDCRSAIGPSDRGRPGRCRAQRDTPRPSCSAAACACGLPASPGVSRRVVHALHAVARPVSQPALPRRCTPNAECACSRGTTPSAHHDGIGVWDPRRAWAVSTRVLALPLRAPGAPGAPPTAPGNTCRLAHAGFGVREATLRADGARRRRRALLPRAGATPFGWTSRSACRRRMTPRSVQIFGMTTWNACTTARRCDAGQARPGVCPLRQRLRSRAVSRPASNPGGARGTKHPPAGLVAAQLPTWF